MLKGSGGKGRLQKGKRLEYEFRDYLRKAGWFVVHQPVSRFPDIVAFKKGRGIAVEIKVAKKVSRKEQRQLLQLKRKFEFMPMRGFAVKENGRKMLMFEELKKLGSWSPCSRNWLES
jgi:Holliday junction resolvase